jgi:hypothetical protein
MALNVYGKKVLAVVHEGVRLTRLIQGINHSDFSLQTVSFLFEVIDLVPRSGEHQLRLSFIEEDVVA